MPERILIFCLLKLNDYVAHKAKNETVPRDNAEESEVVSTKRRDTCACAWLHNDASGNGVGSEGGENCDIGV